MNKWFQFAQSLLPFMLMTVFPGLPAVLIPVIVQGIQEAEQMTGSGAEKKQHVVNLVHLAIQTINTTKGREVIPASVIAIVDRAIDTGISIVNLVATH